MTNLRARIRAINELQKDTMPSTMERVLLSKGQIPLAMQEAYNATLSVYEIDTPPMNDSYTQMIADNAFVGSSTFGLISMEQTNFTQQPIKQKGNLSEIADAIIGQMPFDLSFIRNEKVSAMPTEKSIPQIEKEQKDAVEVEKEVKVTKATAKIEKKPADMATQSELTDVQWCLDQYRPNLDQKDIQAWVHYKRIFGSPMNGWEKWFLDNGDGVNEMVYANDSVVIYNKNYEPCKLSVKNALIGRYVGKTYAWVEAIEEGGVSYFVKTEDAVIKESKYTFDQQKIDDLVKSKKMCYYNGTYIPVPLFTFTDVYTLQKRYKGIYNRENKEYENGYYHGVIDKYGKEIADWQNGLIEMATKEKDKTKMSFANTSKANRPYLSPFAPMANSTDIFDVKDGLNSDCGVEIERKSDHYTLFRAFKVWFSRSVGDAEISVTKGHIIDHCFNGKKAPKWKGKEDSKSKEYYEKLQQLESEAYSECNRLFDLFLHTALTSSDTSRLDNLFNEKNNSGRPYLDYSKIPFGFISNKSAYRLKHVQEDGMAFSEANKAQLLAYGVGFGKTLIGQFNIAQKMTQGVIRKPLIAVPKATYSNWEQCLVGYWEKNGIKKTKQFEGATFHSGVFTGTGVKFNFWGNLSDKSIKNTPIEPNTITIITHDGLEKISLSEDAIYDTVSNMWNLMQGKAIDPNKSITDRSEAQTDEKLWSVIGGLRKNSVLDYDVLGFDHFTIDEGHRAKGIMDGVILESDAKESAKQNGGNTNNQFEIKGSSSGIGRKCFMLCQYMQSMYSGNITYLTATPFVNSPLEIYAIISSLSYATLKNNGISNLYDFCLKFIEPSMEYVPNAGGALVLTKIVKNFKNALLLQNLIFSVIDYKDDPKLAGVEPPCALIFPSPLVSTVLDMSEFQKRVHRQEVIPVVNLGGRNVLLAISISKNNSFSPYCAMKQIVDINDSDDVKYFVEQSPKIKYALEGIRSVKQYHESRNEPMSGQIVYSGFGTDYFPAIKKALINELGFNTNIEFGGKYFDEVEIIMGGVTDNRKDQIKDAFNSGVVKVIVGSSTIKEGLNLQERTSCIWNLMVDWSPTNFTQLIGRAVRQGNRFGFVRIATPLIKNSLDSFINGKLLAKQGRLSSIFDKELTSNEIEEHLPLSPHEIMMELIDNVEVLSNMKIASDTKLADKNILIAKNNYESISSLKGVLSNYNQNKATLIEYIQADLDTQLENLSVINHHLGTFNEETPKRIIERAEKVKGFVLSHIEVCENALERMDVDSIYKTYGSGNNGSISWHLYDNEDERVVLGSPLAFRDNNSYEIIGRYSSNKKIIEVTSISVLAPYGLTLTDDFSHLIDIQKDKVVEADKASRYVYSEEYAKLCMAEIAEKIEERNNGQDSVEKRVADFAKTNYLLSYLFDYTSSRNCAIPTIECCEHNDMPNTAITQAEVAEAGIEDGEIEDNKVNLSKYNLLRKRLLTLYLQNNTNEQLSSILNTL